VDGVAEPGVDGDQALVGPASSAVTGPGYGSRLTSFSVVTDAGMPWHRCARIGHERSPVTEARQVTQCDLWFPEPRIPVGAGQERMLPVLVMTAGVLQLPVGGDDPVAAGRRHCAAGLRRR
jgi:hypothetical protein